VIVNVIDFRKAFDSIHRPALWKILQQYGLKTKIVTVIQKLYDESSSAVRVNVDTSGLVSCRNRCLSELYFVTTVVRYRNRLGATEDHRQQYWRDQVV